MGSVLDEGGVLGSARVAIVFLFKDCLQACIRLALVPIEAGVIGSNSRGKIAMGGDFLWAVIAAVLVTIVGAVGSRILRLWTRERWVGKFVEEGENYSEDLTIYRIGTRIRGRSRLVSGEGSPSAKAKYKIKGVFKHAKITAYFEGIGNPERGAFLIKQSSVKGMRSFSGQYLHTDSHDRIVPAPYTWTPAP